MLLCAGLLLYDISGKKGYHMDELLSFELANAQFNPWIVPTQPQGRLAKFVENELKGENLGEIWSNLIGTVQDVLQNRGASKLLSYQADVYEEPVWITREQFRNYIMVGEEDAFNYLSVYFNVKDDNHPPLHFMALHTVSSIFRGKLTPLMGCGINLVCVLGIMALLMWLGRMLMSLLGQAGLGRGAGIAAALVYGLSGGALNTTLLIRMYAMLTLWAVALLAIHVRKLYFAEEGFGRKNKLLVLVTLMGFWTQYFFLFYCLALAAVTAVLLWRWGRRKELARYVRSMVLAAVVGVSCFPFAISDVFSSSRGVEALNNLSSGLAGYGGRLWRFLLILMERTGGGVMLALLTAAVGMVIWHGRRDRQLETAGIVERHGRGNGQLWVLLLLPVLVYFLLAARMSPYLVDRYVMLIFPMVTLLSVTVAVWVVNRWVQGYGFARVVLDVWIVVLAVLQLCMPSVRYKDNYLYIGYEAQEKVAREYADLDCICVCEGVGYYGNLLEFTHYRRTLLVTMEELADRTETDSINGLDEVVVLSKQEDEERLRLVMAEKYGFGRMETLWRTRNPGDDVVLLFARE